ncbi:MAG TPA: lipocalin family protein [Bacteroidota bacterium]|nr:lipocalin family protein [Bacteroidota bacterium]
MKTICVAMMLIVVVRGVSAQGTKENDLRVVPEVDLQRYMGTWYEIARLPFKYQSQCISDVTATYALLEDGTVQVINRCRDEKGEVSEAVGLARRADKNGPNSKLEVRFAPAWLSWLPMVWGDYWIMVLAPDYSYVAVGGPDREYMWILSRTPSMDEAVLQQILEQVKQNGYDLTGLMRTKHTTG